MITHQILRNNNVLQRFTNRTSHIIIHQHSIRSNTTKLCKTQSKCNTNLQSKLSSDIKLPIDSIRYLNEQKFIYLCYFALGTISLSSLIFLREKLLFGTIGGITAKTCTAPLERLTVFRQASIDYKSSLKMIIKNIYKEEGVGGFWRGNGINVFRASIQKGSLFALQDLFTEILTKFTALNSTHTAMKQSLLVSFTAGWLAGLTSTIITFPLDTIKTINQSTIHQKHWPAIRVWYCLYVRKGLLRGPWIAGLPTALGASLYYGVKFMAFDACLHGVLFLSNKYDFHVQQDVRNAFSGLCAGVVGNSVTYPNNCIRKRMQTAHACSVMGIQSTYTPENWFRTASSMYYNEGGFQRFYKGFAINLARNTPNTAIQFVVYKRLQLLWKEHNNKMD